MFILAAILGAVFNRLRGGTPLFIKNLVGFDIPMVRTLNAVAFGVFLAVTQQSPWFFISGTLAMYVGQSLGWGSYIGAMIDRRITNPNEVVVIDLIIDPLFNKPWLWGFAGLTLRGLFWGAVVTLATLSAWPLLAGALMGVAYAVAIEGASLLGRNREKGWSGGEYIFGAILWVSAVL